ncbi:citrate:proton symporter [Luteococcus sp. H138]|uniref:CitMHS family transporter n=1 Tax=unclassified Luteococcus TaxID=2639923 RepID=UPI00313AA226
MLAIWGYLIVALFMALIMTKKTTPFAALILVPLVIGLLAGLGSKVGPFGLAGIKGVAPTVVMLLFAILYFGLMITAGLFDPLVRFILRIVKGDPLKVLVGTAILAAVVSVDGDGSTTTMIVCSAMIPVYKRLGMKMMDLAVIVILANSVMNLLPWGGPTARIIAALHLEEGALLRRILPGMFLAIAWVICVAWIRGVQERKRLGIRELDDEDIAAMDATMTDEDDALQRPRMLWPNFLLTMVLMLMLVFGGMYGLPKIPAAVLFEIGFAVALVLNYRSVKDQQAIINIHGANALQVITMVLAAGIFMGILNESGMSQAIGESLARWVPSSLGGQWPLVTAIVSAPGTFLLSNDAFYLGVLPILAQTGEQYGFSAMDIGVASTVGQAFHLLSPLVGFIYLLLNLTGVDMGAWQRQAGKWACGTFLIFLISMYVFGGVPL